VNIIKNSQSKIQKAAGILFLFFLSSLAVNPAFSDDMPMPRINVYSGRWTWQAKLEYENAYIKCLFRDKNFSPFLKEVFLRQKGENFCMIENCGPSIQKFEKTFVENKGQSFSILCENPVSETTTLPFWKTKGILTFPGNEARFLIHEEIKILKGATVNFSCFSFDLHAASPTTLFLKTKDKIEKVELKEYKDYCFETNFDFLIVKAATGILGIRINLPVKKGTSVVLPVKGTLFIQHREKTTIGYVTYSSKEVNEDDEIIAGIEFCLFPLSEDIDEIARKMEVKI